MKSSYGVSQDATDDSKRKINTCKAQHERTAMKNFVFSTGKRVISVSKGPGEI